VKKIYWAIVKERPPEDEATISHFMKKIESQNKSYTYETEVKGSKEASLTYKILEDPNDTTSWKLNCIPKTPSDKGTACRNRLSR